MFHQHQHNTLLHHSHCHHHNHHAPTLLQPLLHNRVEFIVFVNLPEVVSRRELLILFKKFRGVMDAFVPHKRTKADARFGFVRFDSDDAIGQVILHMDGMEWRNKVLFVKKVAFGRTPSGMHQRQMEQGKGLTREDDGCKGGSFSPRCLDGRGGLLSYKDVL
ncbi:hypothetical protein Dimus_033356 [Dionaea muscipula]